MSLVTINRHEEALLLRVPTSDEINHLPLLKRIAVFVVLAIAGIAAALFVSFTWSQSLSHGVATEQSNEPTSVSSKSIANQPLSAASVKPQVVSGTSLWDAFIDPANTANCFTAASAWNSTIPLSAPLNVSRHLVATQHSVACSTQYNNADTWYCNWSADDRIHCTFMDGQVHESVDTHFMGAANVGGQGTTPSFGLVQVIGDNPLNLQFARVGTIQTNNGQKSQGVDGRYSCGQLFYEGIWYMGSYLISYGDPNPETNCAFVGYNNPCANGPLVSFAYSLDHGQTWTDPQTTLSARVLNGTNVFLQNAAAFQHTKFTTAHFVDFGKSNSNSPDKYAYLVGHGADPTSDVKVSVSWIQGSAAYVARIIPTPVTINDPAAWEFWCGSSLGWVKGAQMGIICAAPIISWEGYVGPIAISYIPAIRKFLLTTSSPSAVNQYNYQYDSYIAEADSVTGPYSIVSYLNEFGPQGYFLAVPSKFADPCVGADGWFRLFLTYSNDWSQFAGAANGFKTLNPYVGGYGLIVEPLRMRIDPQYALSLNQCTTVKDIQTALVSNVYGNSNAIGGASSVDQGALTRTTNNSYFQNGGNYTVARWGFVDAIYFVLAAGCEETQVYFFTNFQPNGQNVHQIGGAINLTLSIGTSSSGYTISKTPFNYTILTGQTYILYNYSVLFTQPLLYLGYGQTLGYMTLGENCQTGVGRLSGLDLFQLPIVPSPNGLWSSSSTGPYLISISWTVQSPVSLYQPSKPIRVSPGVIVSYDDSSKQSWYGDYGYTTGTMVSSTTKPISNTNDETLFQTVRSATSFHLYFDVTPCFPYDISLYFAELSFSSAGQRVFNVTLNGLPFLTNFDIFAAANGQYTAIIETFPSFVLNNRTSLLDVSFTSSVNSAAYSAVEIIATSTHANCFAA